MKQKEIEKVEIVPVNDVVPRFEISVAENDERIRLVQEFVQKHMKDGEDYGKIPGIEKPSLLKPGAEKLCNIFGFGVEMQEVDKLEDWQRGLFNYVYKAVVRNKRTGLVESECIGSCNSKESKYAYRWLPDFKATPKDIEKADRAEERKAKNGKVYKWYRLPNEDIFSQVNTLQKMAQKRALVGATLIATRASGFLTQDVEDISIDRETEESGVIDVTPPADVEQKPMPTSRPAPVAKNPDVVASSKQVAFIKKLLGERKLKVEEYLVNYSVNSLSELTMGQASKVIEKLMAMPTVDNELEF